MTDTTADATTGTDTGATGAEGKPFEAITSQEQLDKLIGARLKREAQKFGDYDDLKAKAAKFDAAQDAAKTEAQKLQDKLAEAERRATTAETNALRADVAREKGVPAKSLTGSTREELEASADELIEWRGEQKQTSRTRTPAAGLKSGATGTDTNMTAQERAAAALREMRRG